MNPMNPNPTNDQNYHNEQGGESELSTTERYFDSLRDQFAALPMAIFEDVRSGKLRHRDVCLYAHLLCKQGTRRFSFWGIEPLAQLTGTYPTSVKQSIRRLVSCGHIARLPGSLTTHTVCLTRLDPQKGSKRILIKDKSLAAIPHKVGTASTKKETTRNRETRNIHGSNFVVDRRSEIERAKDAIVASMRGEI